MINKESWTDKGLAERLEGIGALFPSMAAGKLGADLVDGDNYDLIPRASGFVSGIAALNIIPAALALIHGKRSIKEQREFDKGSGKWTSLIPGVGIYNFIRRADYNDPDN